MLVSRSVYLFIITIKIKPANSTVFLLLARIQCLCISHEAIKTVNVSGE